MTRRSPTAPRATGQRAHVAPFTPAYCMPDAALRRLSAQRQLQLLIIAAVGLLDATAPVAGADASSSALARPESSTANPIAEVPLDRLFETRNRPLFSPSRRAPSAAQPPAPARIDQAPRPPPVVPPSLVLFGIVVGEQGARAFVATGPADRIVRLRPGDEIDGWKVTAITERRLELSRGDRSTTFTLFTPENAGRTANFESATPSQERTAERPHRIR
jgi:hypothetical protein